MVEDTIIRNQSARNMKLDNEQVLCLSTIGYTNDSKPYTFVADTKRFQNKERASRSIVSVEGIGHDIKGDDRELTASELGCSNNVRDFSNGNEDVGDFVTLNSRSSKNMNPFEDSVLYSDKSVTECELPELVVCYRESAYHFVKDICIDEGVQTQDKFLFDSGADEKSGCDSLHFEKDQDKLDALVTGRTSSLEETPATNPFSSNFQHGNGETSFSAAGSVTGLITYSGPIAYTGNLSIRSDSSTTSTRSFAFPILNTEWNSSPVRMAKADRRQYRKYRGWREGLLCCRF